MSDDRAERALRTWDELKRKKAPWLEIWQLVGEYVHQLKQDFTSTTSPGQMLNKDLFDSTAVDANSKSAAALIGMIWPSSKAVLLQPPRGLDVTEEIKDYYDQINENLRDDFDDPKAGFALCLEEYMGDQTSLGTSAIATFEGSDSTLSFESWGVDEMAIADGFGGRTNVIYREWCPTVRTAIETYGKENLSPLVQKMAENQLDEKISILCLIEPRKEIKFGMMGKMNMPIRSMHIETKTKFVVYEGGFQESPAAVGRFYKRNKEVYGRSPAMKALPDILELNTTKEGRMLALEKALDPPLAVSSDAILGNKKIDTSASAISVLKMSGKMRGAGSPIIPLFDGANIPAADKSVAELQQSIQNHFNLDRLLDFNNETQMTLGEVQYRAQLRGESLGSIFTRQLLVLSQTVERAVGILYRKGRLGVLANSVQHHIALINGEDPLVIPDAVAKLMTRGKDFYKIKYNSPAARMMEAEEANGVRAAWEFAGQVMQADPEVVDNLDADRSLEIVARSAGAPSSIIQAAEKIKKVRAARGQQIQEQQAVQGAKDGVGIAATAAQVKPQGAA